MVRLWGWGPIFDQVKSKLCLSIEVRNFYDKWWTINLYKQNAIEILAYATSREEDTCNGEEEEELVDGEEEEEDMGGGKEEELDGDSIVVCNFYGKWWTINHKLTPKQWLI